MVKINSRCFIVEVNGVRYVVKYGKIDEFRLRKNALHYVLEIMQNEYREEGYATEPRVGGIYCYKNEKTANGDREITEIIIKVEKA
jgi:hypothetical protein